MDWEKVKRVFIYLLVVLNIGLFSMNYFQDKSYVMTNSEESAIYKVIADRGVGLYTDIIKKYEPMTSLSISVSSIDYVDFADSFFEEEEEVSIVLEFDKIMLISATKDLVIAGNHVSFTNQEGTGEILNFNKDNAKKEADEFLKKLIIGGSVDIELESVELVEDAYVFKYIERYKGIKVFSNVKEIVVSKKGVTMANATYFTAEAFEGERKSIISCDQALMTFLTEIEKEEITGSIYINSIELGYDFQSTDQIEDGRSIRLVPCYRIMIVGSEKDYTINGYTNEIM